MIIVRTRKWYWRKHWLIAVPWKLEGELYEKGKLISGKPSYFSTYQTTYLFGFIPIFARQL